MGMIKVGDWVTQYSAGYWKVLEIIPKYASSDHNSGDNAWKKGDRLGDWAILKKGCSVKMKPGNRCECVDAFWCKPVSEETAAAIEAMFEDNEKAKAKFDKAANQPEPYVSGTWLNLSADAAEELWKILETLPERFPAEVFWEAISDYRKYETKPPASYILYLFCYPWELDQEFNQLWFRPELKAYQERG